MTIFGFNTDVKYGDVVYHVQSEARQNDLLLQTMIFVKGQCVGKHAVSYAHMSMQPGFSEAAMHQLLKAQHKAALDSVQQGRIEADFAGGVEVQDVGGLGLALKWTTPSPENLGSSLVFHVQALDGGQPVNQAQVAAFPCTPAGTEALAHATTDAEGKATLPVALTEDVERDSAIMVQATHGAKSATRKFRFRK
jgi:hypothetical protein